MKEIIGSPQVACGCSSLLGRHLSFEQWLSSTGTTLVNLLDDHAIRGLVVFVQISVVLCQEIFGGLGKCLDDMQSH